MNKRLISPSGTQDAFGPVISAGDIIKDGGPIRNIGEIRADIELCLACLEAREICNRHCNECAYLPYEDHFPELAQENYIAYLDRKRREAAIEGIATDRLIELCNAEREKGCLVKPEP